MQLSGRTAVVTGAASGIGRALAQCFADHDMRVVLADVEEGSLAAAEHELSAVGADVLAVPTDVADPASLDALAEAAEAHFGPVHVLCNNAGVSGGGSPLWATTENDWSWVLGVNLMGVVHGIRSFVPRMLAHGEEGHIVNTSSVLGLSTGGGSIYSVSKHAVTRLSEGLWHDLRAADARIGVSVLCPGMVATHIVTAERNRPEHLRDEADDADRTRRRAGREAVEARFLADGMPPARVAEMVAEAIEENRFYVLTHPESIMPQVERRLQAILDGSRPAANEPLMAPRPERGAS
jgi:NAD(P)-dependent dehydrogenase (short-subunit alcohol dehydrogenase family)